MVGRNVRWVEGYTKWSLILLAIGEPVLIASLLTEFAPLAPGAPELDGLGVALLLVLVVVHTAACIHAMGAALRRTDPHRGFRGLTPLAITTAAVVVAIVVVLPLDGPAEPILASIPRSTAIAVIGLATVGALSARWGMRVVGLMLLVVLAVITAAQVGSTHDGVLVLLPAYTFVLLAMGASFRITVWILEVVRELEVSRESHATVAVAEERLRISRDIHDVVGRALAVVAVKSELAATLARRGDARAEQEMVEVNQVAQESLQQVRALVSGYRATDLRTELAGARAVLDSTGIRVTVEGGGAAGDGGGGGSGEGAGPAAPAVQDALGAVVREAVTNVVRHSRATWCTLELAPPSTATGSGTDAGTDAGVSAAWRLTIRNDGASARVPAGAHGDVAPAAGEPRAVGRGNGLRGLAERLAPLHGTLTTTITDDVATLTATVPEGETP
ncbi:sensor histidine kinase [Litorihabitans aurantiacus]|uniref:Histidine kinase n=1 Tax=Litorihabitans aurantiacus TaxID=1930061 RepID=A0AA37XCZ1_9MICO|nr:histidine kinase [Litorihabitans aurantiacus]GMA30826.1 histidine kinase [Litorihabitans aurantiacus]